MPYATMMGEQRTTISVRLDSADTELLDALREAGYGAEADVDSRGGYSYSWGGPKRSNVLRQALRDAAAKAGVSS